eukprot:TRINITY_DN32131_c0_g1_i1.p1 TRINITY_DN32131_c0_g1~~TRINITY_DN32131_c0_g1_i1.p1  ORF type:complete len:423 (+),score=169.36 TRINITY_DN32131_c0_g1_i1:90-1271(+)
MPRDAIIPGTGPLLAYVRKTRAKLGACMESGDSPSDEELHKHIMPSVMASLKRLTGACPEKEHREAIRQIMLKSGCIGGGAGLSEFAAALTELEDYLDGPEEPEDYPAAAEDGGEDLSDLQSVANLLWEMDAAERLEPGDHYRLHPQARCRGFSDRCPVPLFEHVDEERFNAHSCSAPFVALLDNYERDDSVQETVDAQERKELDTFLYKLCHTPQMALALRALKEWGLFRGTMREFCSKLYELWFAPYSVHGRRGPATSCGFEHVFVGEEKKDRSGKSVLTGLHSWVQFWLEERKGLLDYLGFMGRCEDESRVITVRFAWEDDDDDAEVKPASTFLVGTTIAFDFALLTLAFMKLGGEGEADLTLGSRDVKVKCYKWTTRLHEHIRTCYFEG